MILRTDRLELVAATAAHLELALRGIARLGRAIGAAVPSSWPPEHMDEGPLRWTLERLREAPDADAATWWMFWVLLPGPHPPRQLIGTCGYKGPPADGAVEIGYGLVSEVHRRGYATEAARALIARAFARPDVRRIIAETLVEGIASIGVLRKCGFTRAPDPASEPGVLRWELGRPGTP